MSVTPLRTPPADASGGIIVFRIKFTEEIVHTARFHICNFNAGDLAYAPSSLQGTTTEAAVADTATALLPLLRAFYANTWNVRWTALWHNQGGGVLKRVHVPAIVSGAGSGSDATVGIEFVFKQTVTFATVADNHYRVSLVGVGGEDLSTDDFVTSSAGANAAYQALVGYLTGTDTACRGHDGHNLTIPAHVTNTEVMRARRKGLRTA